MQTGSLEGGGGKKKISWEAEKNKMMDMIKNKQELIDRCMEKIELWDEKELAGDDLGEKKDYDKDIPQDPLMEDNYTEQVVYNAS